MIRASRFRLAVGLAAAVLWSSAATAFDIGLDPAAPSSRDEIRIRVDAVGCYDDIWTATVDTSARAIRANTIYDDFCDELDPRNFVTPRFFAVGRLPPGDWRVEYVSCTASAPVFSCDPTIDDVLRVAGIGAEAVPTLGELALALSALSLLLAALIVVARRGREPRDLGPRR